jgi:hypothetical protein
MLIAGSRPPWRQFANDFLVHKGFATEFEHIPPVTGHFDMHPQLIARTHGTAELHAIDAHEKDGLAFD